MALREIDIDNLPIKDKEYYITAGEPKQLQVRVFTSGRKVFYLRDQKNKVFKNIGDYDKKLMNLKKAREIAYKMLSDISNGTYLNNDDLNITLQDTINEFYEARTKTKKESTLKKDLSAYNKYFKPTLANKPINKLEKKDFKPMLELMLEKNIYESLERGINYLHNALEQQRLKGVLKTNITNDLKDLLKFYKGKMGNKIVRHYKAIVDENGIKTMLEILKDYKKSPKAIPDTVNAIYFSLLTAQRPGNIRMVKWCDIDFEKKLWVIKAENMKVSSNGDNIIPLNEYALKILQTQKILNADKEYIFIGRNNNPMSENFGKKFFSNNNLEHTIHGFRSTFRTVCTEKSDELLKQGISKDIAEMILHHTNGNEVQRAYNRATAINLRTKLMLWYGEYLNSLCEFDL